jgi:hypothetical protein
VKTTSISLSQLVSTCLAKSVEDWKRALDENKYIAAISMDLSKAFDCLPHNLLLLKLEAYGLTRYLSCF